MSRRALFTIAPHAPFLPLLAERVLDGTLLNGWAQTGPFWLSDVTIVLPTRRARLTLAALFAERLGGAALLPDIRTFGGESAEEEPFLPPHDAPLLPGEASLLERRLTLSRLVESFARVQQGFASPPNAAEILWLADSLGALIDDLTIENVSIGRLKDLIPAELAANWQDILSFLEIALKQWPEILKERGRIDGATARNERLRRQSASAPLLYGDRPVIAAGSTGSIPATSALLKAIADLPRGALVLPGLDTALTAAQHQALLEGENTQSHPQYGLAKLLRGLGAGIAGVEELADAAARTTIVREALALADATTGWTASRQALDGQLADALDGVGIVAAPNVDMEARAIALAARAALVDDRSVGIVSRDQTLARRIAAELRRFAIEVDDPAGTPLYQSAAGRLARQVLALAVSGYAPVDLVALLHNGAVTLGLERAEVARLAGIVDNRLRGKRPAPGLIGILALIENIDAEDLLENLGEALAPLDRLLTLPRTNAPAFVAALAAAIAALIGEAPLPGLGEFQRWAGELAGLDDPGMDFTPTNLDPVLAALMAGAKVTAAIRRRDDIHIWGELEARLQSPDLMILAGVNEDVWPPAADPGPWMSRAMRIGIGLEPPERQQGQAAHDFEMALGNREVLIAYARRSGTAPALPSRFVQRLDAFVGADAAQAMRARGARWLSAARLIDHAGEPTPAARPFPRPAAKQRPRKLSITEIETLIRSPYDVYARHVLHLKRLDPLGQMPDARERGTLIHRVLARFVAESDVMADDAAAHLLQLADEEFAGLDAIAERRDIWLRRFARTAVQFLAYERGREPRIEKRFAEQDGRWVFPELEDFVLTGRADRVDFLADGGLEILDFKTGMVPAPAQMKAFEAPQLLLEAALAKQGGFAGLAKRPASALTYIKIGLGPQALTVKDFRPAEGMSLDEMVDAVWRRTQSHVAALLVRDNLPMTARIRPDVNRRHAGDYDHLARTDEWTLTAGGEGLEAS